MVESEGTIENMVEVIWRQRNGKNHAEMNVDHCHCTANMAIRWDEAAWNEMEGRAGKFVLILVGEEEEERNLKIMMIMIMIMMIIIIIIK